MMRFTEEETGDKNRQGKKAGAIFFRCIFLAFVIWLVFHKHLKEILETIEQWKLADFGLGGVLPADQCSSFLSSGKEK